MIASRFDIETLGEAQFASPIERLDELGFVPEAERIAFKPLYSVEDQGAHERREGFELAGPRSRIYFNPVTTKAAIVTCGGLCPGINAVIRALVLQLWWRYNCRNILGIRYGFGGLGKASEPPLPLFPDTVDGIHMRGGTMLGSSRGAPSAKDMVDFLVQHRIDMLFSIGGDGTMRGASAIWEEIKKRQLKISIVSLPKTIDNDIPFVKRAFGFETAVATATESVHCAHVEATGAPLGVGLVKLMGRNAGYIAATTCLAAGQANFCLIPEVPFGLDGETGLLSITEDRLRTHRHAVIVVAEGAGQYFFTSKDHRADASGNLKLGNIGEFLSERLSQHFKERQLHVTLKYIDPSYLIRSTPASPTDQLYCARLAQNAVHAAMAGKSGLLIGYWHGFMTHVPTAALAGVRQQVHPLGETWFNVLEATGQPMQIGTPPVDAQAS